jgi:UDP-N-acetylmuramoyl-L-alanyl-D-glutamate--2,6-diaminopimelate ligase
MQAYAEAKARLFDMRELKAAVLNLDDAMGVRLARRLEGRGVRVIGYSLSGVRNAAEFLAATRVDADAMQVESSWGGAQARVNQVGRFNMANALGVAGCLIAYGLPFREALAALEELPAVPGRMQRVAERPLVVVDYAHTPDALEKVLHALRPVSAQRGGRLIAVFGAGGDRDPAKRPLMGRVVCAMADYAVVTSDNPRSEDPGRIIAEIESGMTGRHEVEADRARAIERALAHARDEDVVLIAGKGHENYQEVAGARRPFSDAAVARAALEGRRRA